MPSDALNVRRQTASRILMVASGFAGLGYQIVWTQQCALWLGHESAAVLAVVAAFFGGLALGALGTGSRIERSARPARWYVACEAVIAVWGAVLLVAMAPASAWLLQRMGTQPSPAWQWWVAFGGTFLMLLPATAAMGATLPAMERAMARRQGGPRSIAAHYASNTFGAVLGVLASAFWLVPRWGLTRTACVCVLLNAGCAGLAWWALRSSRDDVASPEPGTVGARAAPGGRGLLARLAMSGLLGIGYEVLVVRVLSQVAEDTVYTFALLLAVYLVGTALGAALYQRQWAKTSGATRLGDRLPALLSLACLAGTASLWAAEAIRADVARALGGGMAAAVTAEAVLALAAFGLPTVAMGAFFSHLGARARAEGVGFGRSLGVNTLAAAFAPPVFGVVLAPWLGPKVVLLLIASAYLALGTWRGRPPPWAWAPASLALAMAVWAPRLAFIDVPEGGHIVSDREGVMASVSVVEDAEGVARLRINNRQQEGSSSSRLVDGRQALLPLLLHPAPRRALFLGLGTGVTAGSAAEDADLHVDVVELLPEVVEASAHFRRVFDDPQPSPRLRTMVADARRYVRAGTEPYDVIVSDNFQPARSGSGALYTVEHFRAVKARLADQGLFCQWLPLHQLDLATLRSVVQSFLKIYPDARAILASNSLETPVIGLVGRADGGRFDFDRLRGRLATQRLATPPARFGLDDEFAVLGSVIAGPRALSRFAGQAAANTDDHPVVAYLAPRVTYAPESPPRDRLMALLRELSVDPDEVIEAARDPRQAERLAAYWAARQRFIEAGMAVRPSVDVGDMLSQVREPLLAVLGTSPDFRPAYDPLLQMAGALASHDAPAARALLEALVRAQPHRPEAGQMLRQLAAPD